MAKYISPTVPQWLLDEFNRIDFAKVNKVAKTGIMQVIKKWSKENLKPIDPKKHYTKSINPKRISKDFDLDLLDLINKYEYDPLPQLYINEFQAKLRSIINKLLPIKESYK